MAVGDGYYSMTAKDDMLDAFGTKYKYVSAHTTDPGSSGTAECSGSVRQLLTYSASSGGSKAYTNAPIITGISTADSVQFLGLWSASSGGVYGGKVEVTPTSATGGAGTWDYEVAAGTFDLNEVASA